MARHQKENVRWCRGRFLSLLIEEGHDIDCSTPVNQTKVEANWKIDSDQDGKDDLLQGVALEMIEAMMQSDTTEVHCERQNAEQKAKLFVTKETAKSNNKHIKL